MIKGRNLLPAGKPSTLWKRTVGLSDEFVTNNLVLIKRDAIAPGVSKQTVRMLTNPLVCAVNAFKMQAMWEDALKILKQNPKELTVSGRIGSKAILTTEDGYTITVKAHDLACAADLTDADQIYANPTNEKMRIAMLPPVFLFKDGKPVALVVRHD